MKLIKYCSAVVLTLAFCQSGFSQVKDSEGWVRVQTDNGEFSVEVPDDHSYFFDADGFYVSTGGRDYRLQDMSLLNAYRNGTLISFEVYRADTDSLDVVLETSITRNTKVNSTKLNGIPARQVLKTTDTHHFVSYYFKSKEFIYIVSSASRTGETPEMIRFIDSVRLVPGSKDAAPDASKLSSLKVAAVNIKTKDVAPIPVPPKTPRPDPGPNDKPLIVISRPRASYISPARRSNTQGFVQLRTEFAKNGHISNFEAMKTLPDGLTRQALFSAMRMKYLPRIKDGQPITSTMVIEYSFAIY